MKDPVKVAVTGAAGQIGYALLFRIASGDMLGKDQPVTLQLLEIPPAMKAVEGVMMELRDGAFPLLHGLSASDKAAEAFDNVSYALLVGSRPRSKNMERRDLLEANGAIFTEQGKALNDKARSDVRVLVVGNPANTNAYIAMKNAPDLKAEQFSAMTRLDHNRAIGQLAAKTDAKNADIKHMIIWGNHSSTQVPDLNQATVGGEKATSLVSEAWTTNEFMPTVQKRGTAIIEARGASSAASAASAAVDHMRNWALGTSENDWVSMAIPSRGQYGIAEELLYSFPVTISGGKIAVVEGLENSSAIQELMKASEQELLDERAAVEHLL